MKFIQYLLRLFYKDKFIIVLNQSIPINIDTTTERFESKIIKIEFETILYERDFTYELKPLVYKYMLNKFMKDEVVKITTEQRDKSKKEYIVRGVCYFINPNTYKNE